MVGNDASSVLTIHADSGDSLVISLDTGETVSPVLPDAPASQDGTYAIHDDLGVQVAQIHWQTV